MAPSSLRLLSHWPCLSSQCSWASPGQVLTGDSIPLGVEGLLHRVERGDVTLLLKEKPPLKIYTWIWMTDDREQFEMVHTAVALQI